MSGPVLIDLDARPHDPGPARRHRSRRPAVAAAALVLVLAGGATPTAYAEELTPVLEGDGRGITAALLTPAALYTQHGVSAGGTSDIWARPVRPGGPEWITQVPSAGAAMRLDPSGTVLVVEPGDAGQATFVDAGTGRVRWRSGDYPSLLALGPRVLEWLPGRDELRVRDVATGEPLWSARAAAFLVDERAHRFVVTLDERRRATVLAAATGRVLTGPHDLGVEWADGFAPPSPPARVIGDRLVVFGAAYVAAFAVDDLRPLWRTPTARPYDVGACGDQICAFSSGGLTVLDPASGRPRWTSDRWRGLADDGTTLLDELGRAARVDLRTGRITYDLGTGTLVGGLQLISDGDDGALVRRVGDGRVLGSLSRVVPGACASAGDLLACRTSDARFRVWRVGRGP